MYDTIRFYQGFNYFQSLHFICGFVFVWTLLQYVCVRKCVRESECARLPVRMSVFASECVYVCMCVIKIADTVLFISFYFHYRSPVLYHWLYSLCHPFLRHDQFSSPHCGICNDIHFYMNHLLFCSEPAQSKGSVVSQALIVGLFTADQLCKLYIESPFIIWSLFGSTRRFNKHFNDNKQKKIMQGLGHFCFSIVLFCFVELVRTERQ